MSIRVMTHVWADQTIQNPYERLLLLALADFSNDRGESYPSVDTLATKCCLTSRGVIKVLERLEEDGKISKKLGGGRGKSNLYTIILPQPEPIKKGEPHSVNTVQGNGNPERHSVNTVPQTLNGVPKNGLNPEPGSPEPLKKNRQETTTTPRAYVRAEDALPVTEESLSSFSSVSGSFEEELKALAQEFGITPTQSQKVVRYAKGRGVGYVREKAAVVRAEPRENKSKAFMAALRDDWAMPKADPEKPGRKRKASTPVSDELRRWLDATTDERKAWLQSVGMDQVLAVYANPGQTCLNALKELLAQEAACAAAALVTPQQPQAEAA